MIFFKYLKLVSHVLPDTIAVRDRMFLKMQYFDFFPNIIKFIQILPNLSKFYPNFNQFSQIYPNFTAICPNFTQICLIFFPVPTSWLIQINYVLFFSIFLLRNHLTKNGINRHGNVDIAQILNLTYFWW